MITFVHTADVHFGMENYGKIDPATGIHTRLLDFEKAFNFCIDFAIEKRVDFFLFAGDAYKTTNPSPTQQRLLLKCLLRLYQAQIPAIITVGNHDNPLSFGKANTLDLFGDLPLDGFHVVAKPRTINLETKNGPVQIVGMPWPTRNTISLSEKYAQSSAHEITEHISKSAASIIRHLATELDPTIPAVLTGHLTVSSGIFSGSEKRAIYGNDPIFLPSQLAIEPFDYVGLGHLHRHQNLNPHGYPAIVYSGSIERIDFGERKEAKGFCFVTIEKKNTTYYEFIETPQRPFVQIEVKLIPESPQTSQIIEAIKQHDLKKNIVKILYHIPSGNQDSVDLHAVQRACYQAHHLIGIIPVHQPKTRQKRTLVNIKMDFEKLFTTYLETKPELKKKKHILLEKALALKHEVSQEELE